MNFILLRKTENGNINLNLRIEKPNKNGENETDMMMENTELKNKGLEIKNDNGLYLTDESGQVLKGDFTRLIPRLKPNNLPTELLAKAAKIKNASFPITAVDATAGLGEDSLILAAAGFNVTLFEKNEVIFSLLQDAIKRAEAVEELKEIVGRMKAINCDSIAMMKSLDFEPDVILLDPMFPERQKSALVKKKLQMIQKLESPCVDECEMIFSAMGAKPRKLIVKRPPKGEYLAGIKPDYSLKGKAVRFDCFTEPFLRIDKFKKSVGYEE